MVLCCKKNCVPKPHHHTGIFETIESIEYFCPTNNRWVLCPEPCLNGQTHDEVRSIISKSERIILID